MDLSIGKRKEEEENGERTEGEGGRAGKEVEGEGEEGGGPKGEWEEGEGGKVKE